MTPAMKKFQDALPDTKKFHDWTTEWLANGGNATKAALKVYNAKDDNSAAVIGSTNLRKIKNAGAFYLEHKGLGYGNMIDHALKNMVRSKNPDWWDRVMRQAGWEVKTTENQTNIQINVTPILGGTDVHGDYGNQEDPQTQKES